MSDKPDYIKQQRSLLSYMGLDYTRGWPLTRFCRALLSVDDEFAAVRDALAAEGRLANTLFVLTGDNGMGFGTSVGQEECPYATQLPLFVSWGDTAAHGSATNSATIENVDWAPTLCELAGCRMGPYPGGKAAPDGQSFLGLLKPGKSSSVPERTGLYLEHRQAQEARPEWRAILTTAKNPFGLWLYVVYDDGEQELYRRSKRACITWAPGDAGDPCLLHNVVGKPALESVRADLAAELDAMVVDVLPSVP